MHHMQIPDTPRARLLDLMLTEKTGEAASDAIDRLRSEGKGWADIASYLTDRSGVLIGREGLRQWAKATEDVAA